jgi:hypothetical protein
MMMSMGGYLLKLNISTIRLAEYELEKNPRRFSPIFAGYQTASYEQKEAWQEKYFPLRRTYRGEEAIREFVQQLRNENNVEQAEKIEKMLEEILTYQKTDYEGDYFDNYESYKEQYNYKKIEKE